MTQKMYSYLWPEFEEDIRKIAEWAKGQNFQNVYGIPRGGLIIAVMLSHLLDIPIVLSKKDVTKRSLIVDDIIDKGGTMERLTLSLGSGFRTASIFLGRKLGSRQVFT